MSGGHFNYMQHHCSMIADQIRELIETNESDEWYQYPDDIIEKFKEAEYNLRRAGEMAQRVDWLVSGDDGEDSFRERWEGSVRKPWESLDK